MECPYCRKEIKEGENTVILHSVCYENSFKCIEDLLWHNAKIRPLQDELADAKEERDHYKALAEKYKGALEEIVKQLIYDDEEELKEWFADIPCDMINDYKTAFELVKHALEGDGE